MKGFPVVILCAALLAAGSLAAQQTANTPVAITVTDPSGVGVSHVQIRLVPAPGPSPKMETDINGRLALDLKPRGYALFAQSPGFKTFVAHIEVQGTKAQTIPIVLQVGATGSPEVRPTAAKDRLVMLTFPYHDAAALSVAELKALPHITVTVHNPHAKADEVYSGVRLADLLNDLGVPLGDELRGIALTSYIVASGSDGYQVLLALAEVDPTFHSGEVLVADTMNDKPLDAKSGPFKLIVSDDKRPARAVRNLTTIELKSGQ